MKVEISKTIVSKAEDSLAKSYINSSVYSYPLKLTVAVDGARMDLSQASRALTGTTGEEGSGVFSYGDGFKTFLVDQEEFNIFIVSCHCGMDIKEIALALEQNVKHVKKSIKEPINRGDVVDSTTIEIHESSEEESPYTNCGTNRFPRLMVVSDDPGMFDPITRLVEKMEGGVYMAWHQADSFDSPRTHLVPWKFAKEIQ